MDNQTTYLPSGSELEIFKAAWDQQLPLCLTGPTGCGKTRLVQHMARALDRPLITVACHEDLTASDLVGRFLLKGGETVWQDGPLTRAARQGAICYLDEIVEARADTTVVIHSLTDHRRELYIDRLDETLQAAPGFMLVVSYNPGYQSVLKDLKPSTRQRMVALALEYPAPATEKAILEQQSQANTAAIDRLCRLASAIRHLDDASLQEAASTRTLIATARLISAGISEIEAAQAAIAGALSDDPEMLARLNGLLSAYLNTE